MGAVHALWLKKEQPICVLTRMGCVDPGSYLLSRDLLSDYHRRANVSLPGSGWDRVGPLGCDHQASACCFALLQAVCPMVMRILCLCCACRLFAGWPCRLTYARFGGVRVFQGLCCSR